jgi:hypothetical protein
MSGNIYDTDIRKIKKEVYDLINDLDNGNDIVGKYEYLESTSKTLYDYVTKGYLTTGTFNKTLLKNNLEMMLNGIQRIQRSNDKEKTQHETSVEIGETLASQYIPQLKKEQEQEQDSIKGKVQEQ